MYQEQKVGEPKRGTTPETYTVRRVKLGGRLQGLIEAGRPTAENRQPDCIFWANPPAIQLFEQYLLVEAVSIASMRIYGVTKLGLRFPDGTSFVIPLADVLATPRERTNRFIHIERSKWQQTLPPLDVRSESAFTHMRMGRRA